MKTDIEIAQEAVLRPITEVAGQQKFPMNIWKRSEIIRTAD